MTDQTLIQIVDAALLDAARRSGPHLACRPGCSQCCTGSFSIHALDARRLRSGYEQLRLTDRERYLRLRARIDTYILRTADAFPGDAMTGALGETAAEQARFEAFANDEVCPVLDPDSQTCDLYTSRPMTCRVFGPPVRSEEGLGVCELCFTDATPEQVAACEMVPDPENLEGRLVEEVGKSSEVSNTIVAYALRCR